MREKGVRCRWLKTEAGVLREIERQQTVNTGRSIEREIERQADSEYRQVYRERDRETGSH